MGVSKTQGSLGRGNLLSGRMVSLVLGSSFLWLCLKSAPLALARGVREGAFAHPGAAIALYALYAIVLLAATMGTARALRGARGTVRGRMLACGAATCGVVALALLPGAAGANAPFVLGLALAGVFVGCFLCLWGARLTALPLESVPIAIGLSYAFSELVRFTLSLAGGEAVRLIFPMASLVLLLICPVKERVSNATERSSLASVSGGIVATSIVLIVLWSLVLGMLPQGSEGTLTAVDLTWSYGFSCCVIALMVAFFWRGARTGRFSSRRFLHPFAAIVVLYLFMITGMLALHSQEFVLFKRFFIAIAQCLEVLAFVVVAYRVSERRLSCAVAFGVFATLWNTGLWMVVSDAIQASGLLAGSALGEWAAFALSFATAVILIVFLLRTAVSSSGEHAPAGSESLRARCESVARACGLSGKEQEVALLLYRGFSAKRIAEELYISENMVRSHTSSIYKKLDVHSKQDLMKLIDRYGD